MEERRECYISCSIERQLKRYAECQEHTERHELLWHEWNHNKRWLTHVQQLILPSFPSYSMHDSTHSEAILHNIEMLLGEYNVTSLSATDCFLILHTAYIHDIGMCITHTDKVEMFKNKKFHKFLEEMCSNVSSDMRKYADILLKKDISYDYTQQEQNYENILEKKLEIYYAVTYLMAEYRRKEHGDVSSERLIQWVDSPEKLGIGFSAIEIPSRLFYIIANCANSHTKWDFENSILESLHQEDSGFAHDYVHPRFIAILLQLGDALDMDNNRFHPLTKEYLGRMPQTSEVHFDKHKSIRRLRITNQKISISADCKNQEVLRLIRQECDGIRRILKDASYYWSIIRPKELSIGLPTFEQTELLLNGEKIPDELVETKFEISQEKAFHLLEGNNIYVNENFVFLRELLQNAVDATKIQYFRDCKQKSLRLHGVNIDNTSGPQDFQQIISPLEYSIEIEFKVAKLINGEPCDITKDDLKTLQMKKNPTNCEYGVLIKIQDYGTGISARDINQIAAVGSSYESRRNEIQKMPKWLQPTGTFGIGLQSAFLSSKVLTAKTCTRENERYEITFYPRSGRGNEGYINVKPLNVQNNMFPYGTSFELFVSHKKKKLHNESPETWSGNDPFEKGYDNTRVLRHTQELIQQMIFYLSDMVGEPLFPINLWIYDTSIQNDEKMSHTYSELQKKSENMSISISVNENKSENETPITWAYTPKKSNEDNKEKKKEDDKAEIHQDANGDLYFLDLDKVKLYIWNHECNAYACVGIQRIMDIKEQLNYNDPQDVGIKIFYKGIKIAEKFFEKDANLIEYIDLKDTLGSHLLKLNRNGFSREGEKKLKAVYEKVLSTVRTALCFFAKEELTKKYINKLKENILEQLKYLDPKNDRDKLQKLEKTILSVAAFVYFSSINEWDEFFGVKKDNRTNAWNRMLEGITGDISEKIQEIIKDGNLKISALFNFPSWKFESLNPTDNINFQYISILDVINTNQKFAILSIREETSHFWNEYMIEIASNIHEEIKEQIITLRKETIFKLRIKAMFKIDDIMRKIMECTYEHTEKCNERKSMHIIRWLLNNIPTMAIYASPDGDKRLNILDLDICDSIYFDFNMKDLTLERMLEKYKKNHISRFHTTVWSGYCYLGLKEKRNSIISVTRGKMATIGGLEMIFPLTGEELDSLYETIKEDPEKYKDKILKLEVINFEISSNYKKKEAYKNMINYIMNHGKRNLQEEQADMLYENYLNEIIYTLIYSSLNQSDRQKISKQILYSEDVLKENV